MILVLLTLLMFTLSRTIALVVVDTTAYWVNLLRYILQGFVTNELAGTSYKIDLGLNLSNVVNLTSSPTKLIVFGPGDDPTSNDKAPQGATLLSLVAETGGGINPNGTLRDLKTLTECFIENDCLEDPVFANFLACSVLNPLPSRSPVCGDEFDAAREGVDVMDIANCFLQTGNESFGEIDPNGVPTNFTLGDFEEIGEDGQRDLTHCVTRAILPPESDAALDKIQQSLRICLELFWLYSI